MLDIRNSGRKRGSRFVLSRFMFSSTYTHKTEKDKIYNIWFVTNSNYTNNCGKKCKICHRCDSVLSLCMSYEKSDRRVGWKMRKAWKKAVGCCLLQHISLEGVLFRATLMSEVWSQSPWRDVYVRTHMTHLCPLSQLLSTQNKLYLAGNAFRRWMKSALISTIDKVNTIFGLDKVCWYRRNNVLIL